MKSLSRLLTELAARAPEVVPGIEPRCEHCQDRGWEVLDRTARPCRCRTSRPIEERLAAVGVGADLIRCSWETYAGADAYRRKLGRFPSPDACATLWGSTGAGKSHAAVAILRETLLAGGTGVFLPASRLISECRASFDRGEQPEDVMARYYKPGLRVLDEAWGDRRTEMADDVTSQFIRRCLSQALPLVITTNLTEAQVNTIEPRVASRIFGVGSVSIDFSGLPDRRRQ